MPHQPRELRHRFCHHLLGVLVVTLASGAAWPDVPSGHWAAGAVGELDRLGLISGYPDGRFAGHRPLNRYETIALLLRAQSRLQGWQGLRITATSSPIVWADVADGHWAQTTLATVARFGWIQAWPGVAEGRFTGERPATRYEWAVAMASLMPGDEAGDGDSLPPGVPVWARGAVARVQARGVMVGDPDGQFHGERSLTRYEAATALARALHSPEVPPPPSPRPVEPAPLPEPGPMLPQPTLTLNLPRVSLGFAPEFLSELGDAHLGEAKGWAMASSLVQADWADGPIALNAGWRYAMYGLSRRQGEILPRQDHQIQAGAGYRWQWGSGERIGEVRLLGFGGYFGRQAGGSGEDLVALSMQAFGLGLGGQLRWPIANRLVAVARTDFYPLLGAQFGSDGLVSGQLGYVGASLGIDWYLQRLSLGLGYRLRYLYDGERRYSQWANGLGFNAGLAF